MNARSTLLHALVAVLFFAPGIARSATERDSGDAPRTIQDPTRVVASPPVAPSLSPPVRSLVSRRRPETGKRGEINPIRNPGESRIDGGLTGTETTYRDALVALSRVPVGPSPPPLFTFEGLGTDGLTPPDTMGEVGPNHYVQMVNVSFRVFDKSGTPLTADTAFIDLFDGSGLTACATENDGDPVALYDPLADRWLLSQFAVSSGNRMCIAISTTADPTGTYWLYQFDMPDYPDYFKFGVWPDAYLMGTNTGFPNSYYAYAFDRVKMLAGAPASFQYSNGHPNFLLPADLDGATPPPTGAPGMFYTMFASGFPDHPPGADRLALYEFDLDWTTPANTTFTLAQEIRISDFNYTVCGFFVANCIPQPGTSQRIDSLSYWPMWRFAYRKLPNREALVGAFTVDTDGTDHAGIRWFELRRYDGDWNLHQEGTHAPDANHRFVGSIAMDQAGNLALGYSISSASQIHNIRYAVRLITDPLGTLRDEETLYASTGVHTGINRWGDYSSMNVDPADDCTFWYTNQYDSSNNTGFNWQTRVGVFRAQTCPVLQADDFESGTLSLWTVP